ncbi:MAG: hypothetical protein EAZ11_11640 [Curvibacter sp.]|nr:MAG: hypothetical protein EAZ11_11640 [Curvibacter sp.]
MDTNKAKTDGEMAAAIQSLVARMDRFERALQSGQMLRTTLPSTQEAFTLVRLERLTLKRHAVLTASLGGVGYTKIADWMTCDETTIKLHLKGALNILAIPTRTLLLARHPDLLDFIPEADYRTRYGISKTWWLEDNEQLMAVLKAKKPANNQHTGEK